MSSELPSTPPPQHPALPEPHRHGPASTARLGWDDAWQSVLEGAVTPADPPTVGRVSRVDRGACDVLVDAPDLDAPDADAPDEARRTSAAGARTLRAGLSAGVARSAAEDPASTPATGDWVLLEPRRGASAAATWSVVGVLPRRTSVRRLEVSGSSHAQVLAANADVVAVVQSLVPDLDLGRVERLLALAWSSGARPVVLLTKVDLHPDPAEAVHRVRTSAPGCEVLTVAALHGAGLEPLRRWLADGATLALLGASGVGKSTLLNALLGEAVMATRELGVEGKGRHTTVTRELHLVPGGGAVIDTPGLRSVGLHGGEDLESLFPEVQALATSCRFADCGHTVEPGCAVLAAIENGDLPRRRLESLRALKDEAARQARRTDARRHAEYRREIRVESRARRRHQSPKR